MLPDVDGPWEPSLFFFALCIPAFPGVLGTQPGLARVPNALRGDPEPPFGNIEAHEHTKGLPPSFLTGSEIFSKKKTPDGMHISHDVVSMIG